MGTEDRTQGPPCLVQQPSSLRAVSALFSYKIDGAALELLQRFLVVFNKTVKYRFNGVVSFEPHQTVNTAWLLEDEAYLHSVLVVASAMWAGSGSTFSSLQNHTQTGYYMNKTLASLRQGLLPITTPATTSSCSAFLSDSRISVVATLAILSTNVGDMRALRAHVAGLAQMVRLRGGMRSILRQSPVLHAKIRRVDVIWSLYSGEAPLFLPVIGAPHHHRHAQHESLPDELSCQCQYDAVVDRLQPPVTPLFGFSTFGPASFGPVIEEQPPSSSGSTAPSPASSASTNNDPIERLVGSGDASLLAVFGASRAISQQLNAALAAGRPLTEAEFAASAVDAQGALVALRGRCATIPAECLRLALLVLLTTTMGLPASSPPVTTTTPEKDVVNDEKKSQDAAGQGPPSPQRYPDLARKFETCIRSLEISQPSSSLPAEDETIAAAATNRNDTADEAEEDQDQDQNDFEADFMLWLLLVGAVSLYGVHRPWLRDLWRHHVLPRGLTRWEQVARRLRRRWVWMDAVHDRLGRHAFEVLTFGRRRRQADGDEEEEGEVEPSEVVDGPKNILWASGWAICPFRL